MASGFVFYRGPSLLDGRPIVAVCTGLRGRSRNVKVGPSHASTWILPAIDPVRAVRTGRDVSVCGSCPHRGGSCYVHVGQAPGQVWRAWKAGAYGRPTRRKLELLRARALLRVGSYGDPAAVPLERWLPLFGAAPARTGYTHQWRTCDPRWRDYIMASVDTPAERALALSQGWRTFRVQLPGENILPGEITCPASREAGGRLTCQQCRACDGATRSPRSATIAIQYHGTSIANGWALTKLRANLATRATALSLPLV